MGGFRFSTVGVGVVRRMSTRFFSCTSNMPHRIFEIEELARLISHHLVSTDCYSAVSLACTCRSLEEPALSSLWELQNSLSTLIRVSTLGTSPTETISPIRRRTSEHDNFGSALHSGELYHILVCQGKCATDRLRTLR